MKTNYAIWVGLIGFLLNSGCSNPFSKPRTFSRFQLPVPTKDEVALVDGRPLTMMDYMIIRSKMRTAPPEQALWVGVSTLQLQNEARSRGNNLTLAQSFDIARFAAGEIQAEEARKSLASFYAGYTGSSRASGGGPSPSADDVKKTIESLNQKSVVIKNKVALSQIH